VTAPALRRLTQFSTGGGCAGKFSQSALGDVLASLPQAGLTRCDADLLVGLDTPDDAAVYAIDEHRAWIVTTDFLTPVVDDPYQWGRIAATNALSDVYAMGGRPLLALNILAWPDELPPTMLADVLAGGTAAVLSAGALLAGGHSIVDPIPKYGLVAIGEVDRDAILTKGGGRAGDRLILTKPIGVGVVSTAVKHGQAPAAVIEAAVASATRLNANAARAATEARLRCGTDITGYGIIGHLHEMAAAARLGARMFTDQIPLLPGVIELITQGCVPDGTRRTLANALNRGWFQPGRTPEHQQLLMADAQTSGGLLLAAPAKHAEAVLNAIHAGGDHAAAIIGELFENGRPGTVTASDR
jgi:selenide,water dikinase